MGGIYYISCTLALRMLDVRWRQRGKAHWDEEKGGLIVEFSSNGDEEQ